VTELAQIKNDIQKIRHAIYGEEIRGSIANALTAINGESSSKAFSSQQGELLHLSPSIDAPIRDIILYGKSTQSGTPTPSAPVAIATAGDGGTLDIVSCGKNIWNPTEAGRTVREVVWTKNADNSYTANGTANGGNSVFGTGTIYLPAGTTVVVKACPSGGSSTTYNAYLYDRTTSDYPRGYTGGTLDTGNGMVYTLQDSHLYSLNCRIMNGKTASNLLFKPQLYVASSLDISSEAYSSSTFTVTVPETGLPGIAVSSGGNYTDPAGQQWLCDTIDLGKGVYTQRVQTVVLDGTEVWKVENTGTANWYYSCDYRAHLPEGTELRDVVLSSHYPHALVSNQNTLNGIGVGHDRGYGYVRIRYGAEDTAENFKTWLSSNNLTVVYPIATPIETTLTDTQLSQLRSIYTRKKETNMYTSGNSGMYIENFVNEKDLYDSLDARVTALEERIAAVEAIALED
jgi:hypothetical protein